MAILLKDGVPPHNLDAEQAALGALLLNWSAISDIVTDLKSDRFYSLQNKLVYEAMISLVKQNITGDILSVTKELSKLGTLEQAGGPAYIASLTGVVPTASNISYYVDEIKEMATRRDLIKLSFDIKKSAYDESIDGKHLLEDAEKKIFTLSDIHQSAEIYNMTDVVSSSIKIIDNNYNNQKALTGIPSGIADLDSMTNGFQNQELIVIGARPSIGKTAFALSMMQEIAISKKIPCGFFSLEMSHQSIGQRLLSQESRIPNKFIRSGHLTIDAFHRIQEAAGRCYDSPLYICDIPNMQLLELRSVARKMHSNFGIKIIFIDYIGLIETDNPRAQVFEKVSEISKSLKALARELDIPVVALCQVAREAEGNEPNLAQLRGSGSVEQDADVVLFLHRDRKIMEEQNPVQEAKCIVAKQRNGATGDVEMLFLPLFTKFENKAKGE